jgi:hypothetical protein
MEEATVGREIRAMRAWLFKHLAERNSALITIVHVA